MSINGQITRAELVHSIEEKWAELAVVKFRYVHAVVDKEKAHYLSAVNVIEEEHRVLWEQLVTGDYAETEDPWLTDLPF